MMMDLGWRQLVEQVNQHITQLLPKTPAYAGHPSTPTILQNMAVQQPMQQTGMDLIPEDAKPVILISKTDIYADSAKKVLLLKSGTEVPSELLPKLLSCGVDPSQFALKEPITDLQEQDREALEALRSVRSRFLADKHVVLLDTQQKSIQRTITTLTRAGFSLGKIHPLRMPQYLSWTVEKYQPSVLVIDYDLSKEQNALDILSDVLYNQADAFSGIEQIIMTVPLNSIPAAHQESFLNLVEQLQIDVLFKPVHQKALEDLLQMDTLLPI